MAADADDDAASKAAALIAAARCGSGVARLPIGHDLDPDEQAETADLADVRIVREHPAKPVQEVRPERRRALRQSLVAEDADGRPAGGQVDGVAHERRRVGARAASGS